MLSDDSPDRPRVRENHVDWYYSPSVDVTSSGSRIYSQRVPLRIQAQHNVKKEAFKEEDKLETADLDLSVDEEDLRSLRSSTTQPSCDPNDLLWNEPKTDESVRISSILSDWKATERNALDQAKKIMKKKHNNSKASTSTNSPIECLSSSTTTSTASSVATPTSTLRKRQYRSETAMGSPLAASTPKSGFRILKRKSDDFDTPLKRFKPNLNDSFDDPMTDSQFATSKSPGLKTLTPSKQQPSRILSVPKFAATPTRFHHYPKILSAQKVNVSSAKLQQPSAILPVPKVNVASSKPQQPATMVSAPKVNVASAIPQHPSTMVSAPKVNMISAKPQQHSMVSAPKVNMTSAKPQQASTMVSAPKVNMASAKPHQASTMVSAPKVNVASAKPQQPSTVSAPKVNMTSANTYQHTKISPKENSTPAKLQQPQKMISNPKWNPNRSKVKSNGTPLSTLWKKSKSMEVSEKHVPKPIMISKPPPPQQRPVQILPPKTNNVADPKHTSMIKSKSFAPPPRLPSGYEDDWDDEWDDASIFDGIIKK